MLESPSGGPAPTPSADPRGPLTVAVAQPACAPGDVRINALAHADAVDSAAARVVVFPELSLTGYQLDTAPAVDPGTAELAPLVSACAANNSVALVGAPIRDAAGHTFVAMMAVTGSGACVVYRKMWLGAEEQRRFSPGPHPAVYDIDGWRLGLAICKDTGIGSHTASLGRLGIDVYVAGLVMHPQEAAEQDERGAGIACALNVPVAFAGFAGPTGSGYPTTAGRSSIWDHNGTLLAGSGGDVGEVARATLPPAAAARGRRRPKLPGSHDDPNPT